MLPFSRGSPAGMALRRVAPDDSRGPAGNGKRSPLSNRGESPIRDARAQPSPGPMKFSFAAASVLVLATALGGLGETAPPVAARQPPAALHSKPPPPPPAPGDSAAADFPALKEVLELARRGKTRDATTAEAGIH